MRPSSAADTQQEAGGETPLLRDTNQPLPVKGNKNTFCLGDLLF